MPTSTFRNDIRAGLKTIIDGFKTANPTLLRSTYRARPASIGDLPAAWVGNLPEVVEHVSGVRSRTMAASVTFLDLLSDAAEVTDRMDDLVDAFLDYLTDRPHITTATIWDRVTVEDGEVEYDGAIYRAVVFGGVNASIHEGRD